MKNIISCLIILAISLIVFSGCAQHAKPETMRQPEVSSPPGEKFQSKVLSEYIRGVQDKVMSNWRRAHGRHNCLAVTSFRIFPEGETDKPVIEKSTGSTYLDGLTIRAINASVPFSPIPPEIKKPNLPVKINFQYVNKAY